MELIIRIPDDLALRLSTPVELERKALEALALAEFRLGHLTRPELRRLLGYETRYELDQFLVNHGVTGTYTETDLAHDREDLKRFGL